MLFSLSLCIFLSAFVVFCETCVLAGELDDGGGMEIILEEGEKDGFCLLAEQEI